MEEIWLHLSDNNPAVLVNGVGGIGKTALASKYLVGYNENYKHLAWLTVSTSIREAFVNNAVLLNNLHIATAVDGLLQNGQPDQALALVINTLSNNIGQTLVVIDNANDKKDIALYRQLFTRSNCHFLLTSRVKPDGWKTIAVESLQIDLAISLFKTHYQKTEAEEIPDQKIENLVQKLFRHTLLIELIAKAARKRNLAFEELEKIINERWIQDPELNKVGIDTGEHGDTVSENLKRGKVNEYIFFIFKSIAVIPEKDQEILKAFTLLPLAEEVDETGLETYFNTLSIDFDLDELEQISESGWLQKNKETQHFSLHPLIAEIVLEKLDLSVDWADPYIEAVSNLIEFDAQDPKHVLSEKNTFRTYAERLKDVFFKEDSLVFAELLDRLGFLDKIYGFYTESKTLRERALEIAIALLDSNQEMIARFQSNLALVLQALGDYEGAKELLEKALKSDEQNFGEENPRTAISYSNLALVLHDLGDYEEAKGLLEKAIKSLEQNFGKDHPSTAISYSNLATVLQDLGDYKEAKNLLEKAIKSDEQNLGKDHPSTVRNYSNLATVLQNLRDYEGAKNLLEKAIKSDEQNLGKDHPRTATNYSNLATVLQDLGDYEGAKGLLEKAIKSLEQNLGKDHPRTATSYSNLAVVLKALGDYEGAKDLLEKAIKSDEQNFGKEHLKTATRYWNLANVLMSLKDYKGAYQHGVISLDIIKKVLPKSHPHIKAVSNFLRMFEK